MSIAFTDQPKWIKIISFVILSIVVFVILLSLFSKKDEDTSSSYSYNGPEYSIEAEDSIVHIYSGDIDITKDDFKDSVKKIFTDIAQNRKTTDFMAIVYTNKEIIKWESTDTASDLMANDTAGYFKSTIVPLEATNTVALYSNGESDDASAGIDWFPSATKSDKAVGSMVGHESWQPDVK